MVDKETVLERLEALEAYAAELDHYRAFSFADILSDFVKYRAIQHSLQLGAQAIADIAVHIITADFSYRIQDYREAIEALGKAGVLPEDFAHRLAPIVGFRNILVHEYLRVDPEKVYEHLQHGSADFREFARYIAAYLKRLGVLEEK